jgi:hypothetical protein
MESSHNNGMTERPSMIGYNPINFFQAEISGLSPRRMRFSTALLIKRTRRTSSRRRRSDVHLDTGHRFVRILNERGFG